MVLMWLFWFVSHVTCLWDARRKSDYLFSGEVTEPTQEERTCKNTGVPTEKFREERRVLWKPKSQVSWVVESFPKVYVNCRICNSSKVAENIKAKERKNHPPQEQDGLEGNLIKSFYYFCLSCSVYFWLNDLKFSPPKKSSSLGFDPKI